MKGLIRGTWTPIEGTDKKWMVDTDGIYYESTVEDINSCVFCVPEKYSDAWKESEAYKMLPTDMEEYQKRLIVARILLFTAEIRLHELLR